MQTQVKICGVTRPRDVGACAAAGAAYVGFVFFAKSPRYLTPAQARGLASDAPDGMSKVALTVDASDATLREIVETVPVDILQLHGAETPQRVAQVRVLFGLPVLKAVGVASRKDLSAIAAYSEVADQLLIDAKPPADADLPGGNGLSFDWRLIAGLSWSVPWMLAGGLTPQTVREAIRLTGARRVDVSSGVECRPGVKDARLIADFIAAVP